MHSSFWYINYKVADSGNDHYGVYGKQKLHTSPNWGRQIIQFNIVFMTQIESDFFCNRIEHIRIESDFFNETKRVRWFVFYPLGLYKSEIKTLSNTLKIHTDHIAWAHIFQRQERIKTACWLIKLISIFVGIVRPILVCNTIIVLMHLRILCMSKSETLPTYRNTWLGKYGKKADSVKSCKSIKIQPLTVQIRAINLLFPKITGKQENKHNGIEDVTLTSSWRSLLFVWSAFNFSSANFAISALACNYSS